MKLLFIRHAETQTNVSHLTHRTADPIGLTQSGRQQAKSLIKVCNKEGIERILSSPERRAIETAQIISQGLGVQCEILIDLAERNWGQWEGKLWTEIEKILSPMRLEERYTFIPPNGESWQQMESRLQNSLNTILKNNYPSVAIVTHEGALRGLMPLLLNTPKDSSFKYHFDNASLTSFKYDNGFFTEIKVNDTSHLK